MSRPDEARATAARTDIASIKQALNLYKLDNHRYPSTEQGLVALVKKPTVSPVPENWKGNGYLERVPNDPWGHAYRYLQPGLHGEIDIVSLGADGEVGGEGSDADIGSWE
jgi:general secretion pathway protein G